MTTLNPPDTIDPITLTAQGAYTMKGPEEVLTMKTLYTKGHSPRKIAKLLGCSHHAVSRYVRNGFEAAAREHPPSALDPHTEFLLERFLQHQGNADVVRQELAAELGIEVSVAMSSRVVGAAHLVAVPGAFKGIAIGATSRFETKPVEQLQIDFREKVVSIDGHTQEVHVLVATLGYSRRLFAKVYPHETQQEWFDGTEAAFAHFGGVPTTVLMDNP